jgi:hypothetical protein
MCFAAVIFHVLGRQAELPGNRLGCASAGNQIVAVLMPGQMLELQYEELVVNFEPLARRIIAYCGLEWDPACLEFHKTKRAVWTASAVQVRQPIYRSSIGRWRPYEDMLRPLSEALKGD